MNIEELIEEIEYILCNTAPLTWLRPEYIVEVSEYEKSLAKIINEYLPKILAKFEELEKEVENLKCCGNCSGEGDPYCKYNEEKPEKCCSYWKSDGLTAKDRKE